MATLKFILVAGPNGSGKSSVASDLVRERFDVQPLDPDAITRQYISRFEEWPPDAANLVGVIEAERRAWKAIARGQSFAVETVLSTDKYLEAVDAAKRHGFETILYFVTLASVEVALGRVKERVRLGGHGVPEAEVRARWKRTHAMCAAFLGHVSSAVMFDNTDFPSRAVALKKDGRVVWDPSASGLAPDLWNALERADLLP